MWSPNQYREQMIETSELTEEQEIYANNRLFLFSRIRILDQVLRERHFSKGQWVETQTTHPLTINKDFLKGTNRIVYSLYCDLVDSGQKEEANVLLYRLSNR